MAYSIRAMLPRCKRKWSEQDTLKFVELYEAEDVLWDVQLRDYKNKYARNRALERIALCLDKNGITPQEINLKINNIRTTYTQEKLKIIKSLADGVDEVYVPSLPWFNVADRFLSGVIKSRKICENSLHSPPSTEHAQSHAQSICCACSPRLHDAANFKRQVQSCDERLRKYYEDYCKDNTDIEIKLEQKIKDGLKTEESLQFLEFCGDVNELGVKQEDDSTYDNFNEDVNQLDYSQDLYEQELISKQEKDAILKIVKNGLKLQKKKKLKSKKDGKSTSTIKSDKLKKHKCKICNSLYASQEKLDNHMYAHKSKYNCLICGKERFKDSKYLVKHIERFHAKDDKFPCNMCHVTFDRAVDLKNHLLEHYKEIPRFVCDVCSKEFGKKTHLIDHLFSHNTGQFTCEICAKQFNYKQSLNSHRRIHEGLKTHMCDTCGKKFSTSSCLSRHIRSMHLKAKNYQCEYCPKKFSVKCNLNAHHRTHTGEKPYQCENCDKKYRTLYGLRVHQQKHSGDRPYRCTVCDFSFGQLSSLKSHTLTHTGEKSFICGICGKGFRKSFDLKYHATTHIKDSTFICEVCKRSFKNQDLLNRHKIIHTGLKQFTCKICDRHVTNLYTHMRFVHNKVKPYTCEVCHKSFSVRGYLKVHMRYHTGEQPYACQICDKKFAQACNWKRHLRIVHSKDNKDSN